MALTRASVVEAALDLLDEVGLEDLTLRRLADRLGVRAPAIYWHVRNKQELLDEMATAMMRAAIAGRRPVDRADVADLLTATANGLRTALRSRRDGGKLFGGTYVTDVELLAGTEPVLRRLVDQGFTLAQAVSANRTIFCYVLGFVIEEQGTQGREDLFDPDARRGRIDTDRFPLNAEAGRHIFGDFDALFAAGVATIVAGVAGPRAAEEPGQTSSRVTPGHS